MSIPDHLINLLCECHSSIGMYLKFLDEGNPHSEAAIIELRKTNAKMNENMSDVYAVAGVFNCDDNGNLLTELN